MPLIILSFIISEPDLIMVSEIIISLFNISAIGVFPFNIEPDNIIEPDLSELEIK